MLLLTPDKTTAIMERTNNISPIQFSAKKMLEDKAYLMQAIREGKDISPTELKKKGIELGKFSIPTKK
jgi:hypothetical protein